MTVELTPPDLQRCQAEIKEGSFMTLGPRSFERCNNTPTWIATEAPRDDGEPSGSMSLCDSCREVCEKKLGDAAVFKKIDLVNEVIKLSNEIKQKEKETGQVANLIPMRLPMRRPADITDAARFEHAGKLSISMSEAIDRIGQGERFEIEESKPGEDSYSALYLGGEQIGFWSSRISRKEANEAAIRTMTELHYGKDDPSAEVAEVVSQPSSQQGENK